MAHETVAGGDPPLDGRPWLWLAIAVSPIVLTILGVVVLSRAVGDEPLPNAPLLVYAAANIVVVVLLLARLSPAARAAAIPARMPTREGVLAGIAVGVVAIVAIDPVADAIAAALGFESGATGTVETTVGAVVFAASAVAVAPVTEEVLYRGLALEALRVRYGALAAVVGSSLLFGGVHVFVGGAAAVVATLLSGLAYAVLRVRSENLAGPVLAHALNNAVAVGMALGLLPDVVPG